MSKTKLKDLKLSKEAFCTISFNGHLCQLLGAQER